MSEKKASQAIRNLGSYAGAIAIEVTGAAFVPAAKLVVQDLHRRALEGKIVPCDACGQTGLERFTDAAGSRDTRDCRNCDGWGMVRP